MSHEFGLWLAYGLKPHCWAIADRHVYCIEGMQHADLEFTCSKPRSTLNVTDMMRQLQNLFCAIAGKKEISAAQRLLPVQALGGRGLCSQKPRPGSGQSLTSCQQRHLLRLPILGALHDTMTHLLI